MLNMKPSNTLNASLLPLRGTLRDDLREAFRLTSVMSIDFITQANH